MWLLIYLNLNILLLYVFYLCHLSMCFYFAFFLLLFCTPAFYLIKVCFKLVCLPFSGQRILKYLNSSYLLVIVFVIFNFSVFYVPGNVVIILFIQYYLRFIFSVALYCFLHLHDSIWGNFSSAREFLCFLYVFLNEGLLLLNFFRSFLAESIYFIFTFDVYIHWT